MSSADDLTLLPSLVSAGVDCFQVRDKSLSGRALVALTTRVLAAGATVVVNDRADVALAAGAHGVHLGAADVDPRSVRRFAASLMVGVTCRDENAVRAARAAGADYAGVGPVFSSSSKAGLPAALGLSGLGSAVAGGLPVIGIGGITAASAGDVVAAGARGVAVIGGIWGTPDPVASARSLAAALEGVGS
ncbi:thiamine phosphate synthase [Nocardioides montaniterrae]